MGTILVQTSNPQWTTKAMHLACALSRNTGSNLVLLHLVPVKNPGLMAGSIGISAFSPDEERNFAEYDMIAEDYGVKLVLQPMLYMSRPDALIEAVMNTKASVLFADLPDAQVRFWNRFQLWNLRRQLTQHGCQLHTLASSDAVRIQSVSSVTLKTAK